jgi:hypothetical protein
MDAEYKPWWPEADERERRINAARSGEVRYLSGRDRNSDSEWERWLQKMVAAERARLGLSDTK